MFIEVARDLFNFEECTWTHGVLNLLHASNIVHMMRADDCFSYMDNFDEYRLQAYSIFCELGDLEGQADSYFLWAIMLLFKS